MHQAAGYAFPGEGKKGHANVSQFAWFFAVLSNYAWLLSARNVFARG